MTTAKDLIKTCNEAAERDVFAGIRLAVERINKKLKSWGDEVTIDGELQIQAEVQGKNLVLHSTSWDADEGTSLVLQSVDGEKFKVVEHVESKGGFGPGDNYEGQVLTEDQVIDELNSFVARWETHQRA